MRNVLVTECYAEVRLRDRIVSLSPGYAIDATTVAITGMKIQKYVVSLLFCRFIDFY